MRLQAYRDNRSTRDARPYPYACVDTAQTCRSRFHGVGGNEAKIRKYIQEQELNDQMCDQLSFKEYEDPFKNVADFDDDDSPEVPTDSMRK